MRQAHFQILHRRSPCIYHGEATRAYIAARFDLLLPQRTHPNRKKRSLLVSRCVGSTATVEAKTGKRVRHLMYVFALYVCMCFSKKFGDTANGFDYPKWATSQNMIEHAALFKYSATRDFAKKPSTSADDLKAPQSIGACERCDAQFLSQCSNATCLCRVRTATFCCACVALNDEHRAPKDDECFDFEYALCFVRL